MKNRYRDLVIEGILGVGVGLIAVTYIAAGFRYLFG